MTEHRVRIAAVGAGRGGSVLKLWAHHAACEPAAVCDLDSARAQQAVETIRHDHPWASPQVFDSLDAMLAWGGFEAVIVATPDRTHHEVASQIMRAGKAVYVEKPMTTTVADAADLLRCWRETAVVAAVGHEFRHTVGITQAREFIEAGRIGTPRLAVTLDYCGRMGSYWRRKLWRDDAKTSDDSLTLQKAIHQLDIQGYLLGQAACRVWASQGQAHYGGEKPAGLTCETCDEADTCRYEAERAVETGMVGRNTLVDHLCVFGSDVHLHDHQTVQIDYADGARGSYVECFFTPEYRCEHQIIGDRGQINVRYVSGLPHIEIELLEIGTTRREIFRPCGEGMHGGGDAVFAKIFCEAVRTGQPVQPDLQAGYRAVALAKAIDESARTAQPIRVEADPETRK